MEIANVCAHNISSMIIYIFLIFKFDKITLICTDL